MAVGAPQATKRALVKVLLVLAAFYTVNVTVSRESTDEEVLSAYKKVSLKAHPDKGGRLEHCQELNNAKDAWDKARRTTKAGRPKQGGRDHGDSARPGTRPEKRERAEDPPAALDGGGFDGARGDDSPTACQALPRRARGPGQGAGPGGRARGGGEGGGWMVVGGRLRAS